mmetsp:Transcript_27774/g.58143  ORF Transcript_27774/g.58143 Transcript_27774/m.58143 type:complete len:453 (-) Transcript_27774:1503-2861(-)
MRLLPICPLNSSVILVVLLWSVLCSCCCGFQQTPILSSETTNQLERRGATPGVSSKWQHEPETALYAVNNKSGGRQVELGIFGGGGGGEGAPSDPPKSKKAPKARGGAKVPEEEEEEEPKKMLGGVRAIFRRIRGGGKKDSDDDEAEDSKNNNNSKSKVNARRINGAASPSVLPPSSNKAKTTNAKAKSSAAPSPPPSKKDKSPTPKGKGKTSDAEEPSEDAPSPSWTSRFLGGGNKKDDDDDDAETSDKKKNKSSLPSVVQKLVQKTLGGDSSNNGGEKWVTVFPKTRIYPGEMVPVTVDGIDLLVIASNDGKKRLYCIENSCPHLGTPLELGQLVRLPRVEEEGVQDDDADAQSIAQQTTSAWTELQVSSILQQDGCEDCIVCPLHKTAFALESGQPRGEWCPYPPVVGKLVGSIKKPTPAPTFGVRVRGKDVQVRMNTPVDIVDPDTKD